MAYLHLNRLEVQDLINRYSSELKKLKYQMEKTQTTIDELQAELENKKDLVEQLAAASAKSTEEAATPAPAPQTKGKKRGPKPKKKNAAQKAEVTEKATEKAPSTKKKRGPGRPPKAKTKAKKEVLPTLAKDDKPKAKRRVRFSETDVLLMDTLDEKGQILIASELLDVAMDKAKSKGEKITEDDMKIKINRSLQKLANRRDEILKVSYDGRGFAYALPEWVDKKGVLKPEFAR